METVKNKKRGPAAILSICPGRNSFLLLSAALIALHLVTRRNAALMERISTAAVRPVHRFLARATGRLPFSLAELLIALAVVFVTLYIAWCLCLIIKGEGRGETLYRLVVTPLSVVTDRLLPENRDSSTSPLLVVMFNAFSVSIRKSTSPLEVVTFA